MKVLEIFESIQGEGPDMGKWCTFIRLAGCNLACPWCDTKDSWSDKDAKQVTVDEVLKQVKARYVVFTGGEPTLQYEEVAEFGMKYTGAGTVAIETNGTAPETVYAKLLDSHIKRIVVSPKPLSNFQVPGLRYIHALKYVVDEKFMKWIETEEAQRLICDAAVTDVPIYLQPCDGPHIEQSMKDILTLCREYPYLRAGIQLHKVYKIQ